MTTPPGPPLPVRVSLPDRAPQRRWTVLVRWILCTPLLLVVIALGVATVVVIAAGWLAALVTGRLPEPVRRLVTAQVRLTLRLAAYDFLLTDAFPAFAFAAVPDDATHLVVPTATPLNRGAVAGRLVLALPAAVLGALVFVGMHVLSVVMWFVVLATGRLPAPVHQAFSSGIRFGTRLGAFLLLLVPTYPAGLWEDRPASGRPVLVLAVVLGVVAVAAPVVLAVSASHAAALDSLARADRSLIDRFDAYEHQTEACPPVANPYRCLEQADAALVPALVAYGHRVGAVPGSGLSPGVIDRATTAARRAASAFAVVGRAPPTKAGYRGAVPRSGLAAAVQQLQDAVNALSAQVG